IWQCINLADIECLGCRRCGRYAAVMFVAITCPTCRHRGYISKDMLPRWLSCSHCRSRARFDRGSPLSNEEVIAKASYAARQSPDHLLDALWRDGARPAIGGQAAHQR